MPNTIVNGRSIFEALTLAVEGLPNGLSEWFEEDHLDALRSYLKDWIMDYAKHRNVLLADQDIDTEIEAFIDTIRRTVT